MQPGRIYRAFGHSFLFDDLNNLNEVGRALSGHLEDVETEAQTSSGWTDSMEKWKERRLWDQSKLSRDVVCDLIVCLSKWLKPLWALAGAGGMGRGRAGAVTWNWVEWPIWWVESEYSVCMHRECLTRRRPWGNGWMVAVQCCCQGHTVSS